MQTFLELWHQAARTSVGFFWMALWAFVLGYVISSLIQVLVTQQRMQKLMGKDGPRSVALGTFFGFLSSSCSFSALSTTRALFSKGAGLAPSMAFMLASTNLVVELGMVIAIFLGWQFVVGEYVGGMLLILVTWLLIRVTRPRRLERQAREKMKSSEESADEAGDWRQKIRSAEGWQQIGQTYVMEWQMVWKDVLIGFTVAGAISAMVPESFFQALFVGSGGENAANPGFAAVLAQAVVGPVAAFFTFIGSMGNIPLAAVLFSQGVSFAGVMAFIFSDLVVLPVLRINAAYYGWKMALYILALMLVGIVSVALAMHYALAVLDLLPSLEGLKTPSERDFFQVNYQLILNLIFLMVTVGLLWFWRQGQRAHHGGGHHHHHHDHGGASLTDRVLQVLSVIAVIWLLGGWLVGWLIV